MGDSLNLELLTLIQIRINRWLRNDGILEKISLFQDIDTISDFLGEKKYLMGEEVRDNKDKVWGASFDELIWLRKAIYSEDRDVHWNAREQIWEQLG